MTCGCCGEERERDWFPAKDASHPLYGFCYSCLDDLNAMGTLDGE